MSHTNASTTLVRKSTVIFVVVGLSVLSAATLAGQGPFAPATGPLDLILQKLVALEEAVDSLAPPPEPSEVTLRTSAVPTFVGINTFVSCTMTNVSSGTIVVVVRLLKSDGTAVFTPPEFSMEPGHTITTGLNENDGTRRCEFRFTGFADDIRANMTAADKPTSGVPQIPTAVFEAR